MSLLLTMSVVAVLWPVSAIAQVCLSSCDGFSSGSDDPLEAVTVAVGKAAKQVEKSTKAVNPAPDETGEVVDQVQGILDPTPQRPRKPRKAGGGGTRRPQTNDPRSPSPYGTPGTLGGRLAAREASGAGFPDSRSPDRSRVATGVVAFIPTDRDAMDGFVESLGTALEIFKFPLTLIVMVVAFLVIQGRVDSRDPKLAFAPVSAEHDYLSFS